ncbi:hypothetical protein QBC32DRAFT_374776 [Pseudoneurospora amorphoporcata]|uniref:Uncharacterized protein n=1 Tax=Pseudoneurospora amorphoporcata TaxID=241081 RepID=A0AAN6NIX9_9PEZI|nr:hypothetical protein QBC32DRAFT_374776 [Pseudoneurospora amorphoporcata]
MSFTSTFDWVPRGLTFTDTAQDHDLHIHYGAEHAFSDSDTADPTYQIKTTTPNPSYLTPPFWIKSIVSQHSKSLILLESRNGPQEPGFAAPKDVFYAAVKSLGLKKEQVGRIVGKNGSLTDYFFSGSVSDASLDIAFRWTSKPGCYVIFFGRFTSRVSMGALDTNRMAAVVSHRGLFPSSISKKHDNNDAQNNDVMDHELKFALVNRAEEIQENPLRVFTVLLQECVCHLDEEIHELGVRLEDTPSGAVAQIAKEMAPDICGLKKACNDLLAICEGYSDVAKILSEQLRITSTDTCVHGLRRDAHETKMLVERRLEKLNYIDGNHPQPTTTTGRRRRYGRRQRREATGGNHL